MFIDKIKEMMFEEEENRQKRVNYAFFDGFVPTLDGKYIVFEKFNELIKDNKKIFYSPSQMGPVYTIDIDFDIGFPFINIPSTPEFINSIKEVDPNKLPIEDKEELASLYYQYLTILGKVM